MYKTLYQTESNLNDLRDQSKRVLTNARTSDYSNYTAVRLFMLNGKEILISRIDINIYSVIIRNQLGFKIDGFEFDNLETNTFDFIKTNKEKQ